MFGKKEKPENVKKQKSKKPLYFLIMVLMFWGTYSALQNMRGGYLPVTSYSPSNEGFQQAAHERLDKIIKSIPEAEGYACEANDCQYVVYFDFKSIPKDPDLDYILRGNTVTYSNFTKNLMGTSHVTLMARLKGKVILKCNGDNGMVRECT